MTPGVGTLFFPLRLSGLCLYRIHDDQDDDDDDDDDDDGEDEQREGQWSR